ncbi:MAG: hypothetical protein J6V82_02830 [Clostridia bacterium]|nr:hypothetical protein [Clostridia bacterium]
MKVFGNLIWFLLFGFLTGFLYFVLGLVCFCTLIGIPFGKKYFKMVGLTMWPYGTKVTTYYGKRPIANLLWLILGGFIFALFYLLLGIVLCVTLIGIPLGKQSFKLARYASAPFGATLE